MQDLSGEHVGAVWCMKFSACGRLLATAGQDRVLRIWVLRDAFPYFLDMRTKYNAEKVSPTPSQESLVSQQSMDDPHAAMANAAGEEGSKLGPFMPKPFCTYTGHTSDLLDISWSKNYFVLSSSMDKTVSFFFLPYLFDSFYFAIEYLQQLLLWISGTIVAHLAKRMPLLLPAHRFRHGDSFSSKG